MTALETRAADPIVGVVFGTWLERYGAALEAGAVEQALDAFVAEPHWKDILAFTWGYRTFSGRRQIRAAIEATIEETRPCRFSPAIARTPPRAVKRSGREVIEGFFDFETAVGRGVGFARLLPDPDDPSQARAWVVLTTLQGLWVAAERIGPNRPTGLDEATRFGGQNWLDRRQDEREYRDREPDVLVVGGGQGGLALAARLGHLGVETLVVEQLPRIGDNWRNRYRSLTLHNEVWANHLPYMPFPDTWPTFVPKDKLAGWLESYVDAMDLDVWTSTRLVGATYDAAVGRWEARVERDGAPERLLRPRHLVLATGGASGVPNTPTLAGLDAFTGEVMHSSRYSHGGAYRGRRAIVMGTGNSGHDVAQDLFANGAEVTLVQRSPTCVLSLIPSASLVYSLFSEGPPVDDVDLITAALPFALMRDVYQWLTKRTCELDKELLDSLHRAGYETDFGEDETGFYMMYLRRGGGYYINVGCADLIASGEIGVVQARDIDALVAEGLRMSDGTVIGADLLVLATGYDNQQEGVRRLLGDEVADLVGPIWGFDDHHAMRNMWQPTPQEGLWIMGGSLIDCRHFSRYLSLFIAAELAGLDTRARVG